MENFFNYITKPLKPEDIDIWFKMNNIISEKMELYSDFCHTLYILIYDTYLGQDDVSTETKIKLTDDDNLKHFEWLQSQLRFFLLDQQFLCRLLLPYLFRYQLFFLN